MQLRGQEERFEWEAWGACACGGCRHRVHHGFDDEDDDDDGFPAQSVFALGGLATVSSEALDCLKTLFEEFDVFLELTGKPKRLADCLLERHRLARIMNRLVPLATDFLRLRDVSTTTPITPRAFAALWLVTRHPEQTEY